MEPFGLVGFVTDFGEGPYAGALRAVVKCLGAEPVDLDHSVPSFSVIAGAYVTFSLYKWLPPGSAVVAVVDPGVGGPRRPLLVETRNYYLVGPDNGVLYPAAADDGVSRVYILDPDRVASLVRERARCPGFHRGWRVSNTFHGRDVFTPAAALAATGVEPSRLGDEADPESVEKLEVVWEREVRGRLTVKVVYVDRFGNVALSTRRMLPEGAEVEVTDLRGHAWRVRVGRTFSDVREGMMVMYLNSFGFLEIAVNKGSAAERLHAKPGDRLSLRVIKSSNQ
ncbi:SAM hydrolase/SAM-dependent halogenase family protein [Stetteria hydrogenophila]